MIYNKNNVVIEISEYDDVVEMAPNVRKNDVIELAALGLDPLLALMISYEQSKICYTVKVDDCAVGMFGLNSQVEEGVLIWMIATDDLTKIQRRFVRNSRAFISEALSNFKQVYNYVDARNQDTINWLKWLGASFEEAEPYGVNGESFHRFTFTRGQLVRSPRSLATKRRDKIHIMEQVLVNHPDAIMVGSKNEPPVTHEFTDGMYTRTIKIPAGMILTGKIHKHDHPNFLMKGKVKVYTEHKGLEILEAPKIMMSKAGTKRVVVTLEDTVWSTVHANPTNTKDLDELENNIIASSYEQIEVNTQEVLQ